MKSECWRRALVCILGHEGRCLSSVLPGLWAGGEEEAAAINIRQWQERGAPGSPQRQLSGALITVLLVRKSLTRLGLGYT